MLDPKNSLDRALLHYFEQEENAHLSGYDIEVLLFLQGWSDTTIGFGGIGGQAMTSAYTVVINDGLTYYVYFGGRFAYKVNNPTSNFFEHLMVRYLEPNARQYR